MMGMNKTSGKKLSVTKIGKPSGSKAQSRTQSRTSSRPLPTKATQLMKGMAGPSRRSGSLIRDGLPPYA